MRKLFSLDGDCPRILQECLMTPEETIESVENFIKARLTTSYDLIADVLCALFSSNSFEVIFLSFPSGKL